MCSQPLDFSYRRLLKNIRLILSLMCILLYKDILFWTQTSPNGLIVKTGRNGTQIKGWMLDGSNCNLIQ